MRSRNRYRNGPTVTGATGNNSAERFNVETGRGRRAATGLPGDQGSYYGDRQNVRGPGASNHGSSKYGGSDYEFHDYDRYAQEHSNVGGPYSEQHNDDDNERLNRRDLNRRDMGGDIVDVNRERLSPRNALWRAPSVEYSAQHARQPHAATEQGARTAPSHYGKGPKGYVRSDARLEELVCEQLMQAHDIDASDMTVSVNAGEVTLSGTVSTRRSKYAAENLAADVNGVRDVVNQLKVQAE